MIFVHVPKGDEDKKKIGDIYMRTGGVGRPRAASLIKDGNESRQIGHRTQVKHFKEDVSKIEILPGARFTIIAL